MYEKRGVNINSKFNWLMSLILNNEKNIFLLRV